MHRCEPLNKSVHQIFGVEVISLIRSRGLIILRNLIVEWSFEAGSDN